MLINMPLIVVYILVIEWLYLFCFVYMHADDNESESHINLLSGLMCAACQYYSTDNTFQNVLKKCHWDGMSTSVVAILHCTGIVS